MADGMALNQWAPTRSMVVALYTKFDLYKIRLKMK